MQEPVFVLHLFTCHGRIMPCLAELLLSSDVTNPSFSSCFYCKKSELNQSTKRYAPYFDLVLIVFTFLVLGIWAYTLYVTKEFLSKLSGPERYFLFRLSLIRSFISYMILNK